MYSTFIISFIMIGLTPYHLYPIIMKYKLNYNKIKNLTYIYILKIQK